MSVVAFRNTSSMSEIELLEAQLEQATRLASLGRLAATLAHEFNNVLMGIQPFAQLLQRPALPPAVVAKSAGHIMTSVARGKRIAQDILRFAQPPQTTLHPLDFTEWCRRFVAESAPLIPDSVTLRTELSNEPLRILSDGELLSQVFASLTANARDAMPNGGTITIAARQPCPSSAFSFGAVADPERFVQISFSDTGTGIAPHVLPRVFDPLFTTKHNRTGLGLAVAHQIVTDQGGHLFVESAPGSGTTFHLFLRRNATEC